MQREVEHKLGKSKIRVQNPRTVLLLEGMYSEIITPSP